MDNPKNSPGSNRADPKMLLRIVLCALFGAAAGAAELLPVPVLPALLVPVLMFATGSMLGFFGAVLATITCLLSSSLAFGTAAWPAIVFAGVAAFGGMSVTQYARRSFEALVGACGVTMLGVWCNILISARMLGNQVIEQLFVADEATLALMRQSYALMGYTEREIAALTGEFAALYGEMVPAILLAFALFAGLCAFLLSAAFQKGSPGFTPPSFSLWALPKGNMMGSFLMLAIGYVGAAQQVPGFSSVLLAAQVFILGVFSLQGLAVIWFILGRTRFTMAAKVPLLLISLLFVGTGLLFVAIVENTLQFRRRLTPPPTL